MAGIQPDGSIDLFIGSTYIESTFTDYYICVKISIFYDGLCNRIAEDHTSGKYLADFHIAENGAASGIFGTICGGSSGVLLRQFLNLLFCR